MLKSKQISSCAGARDKTPGFIRHSILFGKWLPTEALNKFSSHFKNLNFSLPQGKWLQEIPNPVLQAPSQSARCCFIYFLVSFPALATWLCLTSVYTNYILR